MVRHYARGIICRILSPTLAATGDQEAHQAYRQNQNGILMKLSGHQQRVIQLIQENGGITFRLRGGFWVTPGTILDGRSAPRFGEKTWNISTIRSLEKLGLLERTHKHEDEWRDVRRATGASYAEHSPSSQAP